MVEEVVGKETEVTPTPTAEEQMAQLQAELQKVKLELEGKDKGLRTAHQTLTEKDKQVKSLTDLHTRIDGLEQTMKMLAGMVAEEEISPEKKVDYLKKFEEVSRDQENKRREADLKTKQDEYNRQADTLYEKAKELLGDDEDALFQIRSYLRSGDLDLAERKISKAKPKEPKESEEARIERLVQERLKGQLEAKGLLKTETAAPSGKARTREEAIRLYAEGLIGEDEASKAGVKFT